MLGVQKHPLVDKRTTWQSQDDVIEKERQPIKRGGEQNGGAYVCTQIHFVPGALLACFSLYLFKNSHNKAMARCYYPHHAHQGGYLAPNNRTENLDTGLFTFRTQVLNNFI